MTKTKSNKHTEIPYICKEQFGLGKIYQASDIELRYPIATAEIKDARFIVKSVNNHDRLVEALRELVDYQGSPKATSYPRILNNAKQLLSELDKDGGVC